MLVDQAERCQKRQTRTRPFGEHVSGRNCTRARGGDAYEHSPWVRPAHQGEPPFILIVGIECRVSMRGRPK